MTSHLERFNTDIDVDDLRRFAKILIDDLSRVLIGYELIFRLLDSPERTKDLGEQISQALARNQVLVEADTPIMHLPVVYQDKPLALVTARPTSEKTFPEQALPMLSHLVRLSLEKILLYKINVTDRETGLNNEYYCRAYIRKQLEDPPGQKTGPARLKPLKLSDTEHHPGLTLILVEIVNFEKIAQGHGRIEAIKALMTLAGRLKEAAPGPCCLARLTKSRLGLVLPREDRETCLAISRKLVGAPEKSPQIDWPGLVTFFGLASYPQDFTEKTGQGETGSPKDDGPAGLLMTKAEMALHHAMTSKGERIFTFQDVLRQGGRVVQTLPYNRVVVNLGRNVGAREGQFFILRDADKPGEVDFKGEILLFDVQEDFSLGELVGLNYSHARIQPGDVLVLSRTAAEEHPGADRSDGLAQDQLLGIPDHQGFTRVLNAHLNRKKDRIDRFALILIRVDGYDQYRTTMGHLESDRQFKALFKLIATKLPQDCLPGRFSSECLSIFCPGFDEDQARRQAESWRDQVAGRLRQTASFGVAVYPCGSFSNLEIMANAQKALDHASFLGPSSVAVFDSVSLNISGDKRFESGDWEGAVQEYNRALELNPRDLNVLNSLGVCHGYQQRPDLALEVFSRVLEIDPQNLMAHYNQGFALAMEDRTEEALNSFRQAAALDPANFEVLFQLGKLSLQLDLIDEAILNLTRAAALENRNGIVYRYLGQALLKGQRFDQAIDAFKAAARHDPEDAPSLSQLGVLFLEKKTDLDVALSLIGQSVELDPTNSLFRQRLARAHTALGDLKKAEEEYNRVLEMGARSREVFYELGLVLKDLGLIEEARSRFREALEIDREFKPAARAMQKLSNKKKNSD